MNTRLRMQVALLACCSAAPLAMAADKLDVKPGLWEITSSHHITGIPPMPKEWVDKVTPEQRAAMETAFRKESEKGPQTDTERECITKEDAERPFDLGDKDCTQTVVRTTRTTQEVRLSCNGETKGTGVLRVTTPTPETMTGSLDLQLGDGGKDAMRMKSEIKGRWLGPDCGDEADSDEDAADDEDEDETG
jgi:hypothetical protein